MTTMFGLPDNPWEIPASAPINRAVDTYRPHRYQHQIGHDQKRFTTLVCHRRFGKALDVDTLVPMADGSWSRMGSLEDGDQILGSNGQPTRILQAHEVLHNRPCYEVEFASGEVIVADAEHLWVTTRKKDRHNYVRTKAGRVNQPRPAQARTTQEIFETLKARGENNHRVQLARAAQYPEQELPVDPYLLGVWLGDGTARCAEITTPEPEIVSYLESVCGREGWSFKKVKYQNAGKATTYRLNNGFQTALNALGVLGNKHIPEVYQKASVKQRIALIQGLMDTDGCINKQGNFCEFSQKRLVLFNQAVLVLRSLGVQVKTRVKVVKDEAYNVATFRPTRQLFHAGRKAARYVAPPENYYQQSIVGVRPVASRPVRCITVDADDSLYCVGEHFTVTHNTVFAVRRLIGAARNAHLHKRPDARFGYIAPYLKQAREVAWLYSQRFSGPTPQVKFNQSEGSILYPNGAKLRLFGADNPDAMRGLYFDGVVFDEVADMRPQTWGEIVRPALADRKGWALFIGTPKGVNLFHELYELGLKQPGEDGYLPGWHSAMYTIRDTLAGLPHLDEEEIMLSKGTMSDAQFRQEFLCDFQAACDNVLIPIDLVGEAMGKFILESDFRSAPKVLGVDVARFGDDRSSIVKRQGLASFMPQVYRGLDNMQLAARVALTIDDYHPDAVFIDGGRGEGVIDRLRQLGYDNIIEVPFGGRPDDMAHYSNKRTEMWDRVLLWLKAGGCLPKSKDLQRDLVTPTFKFDAANRMVLEKKEDMKERGMPSPDVGDGLALTFAYNVIPQHHHRDLKQDRYNPLDYR